MFCCHSLNCFLNQIHEHALVLIYNDHVSFFEFTLEISNESTINHQNLEFLANEICKFLNGSSPPTMSDLINIGENPYNLRNIQTLFSFNKNIVKFGVETIT